MKQNVLYGIMAFISPCSFLLTDIYVDQYEGWGQWAAASILLIPLFLSLMATLVGIILIFFRIRKEEPPWTMVGLSLVAISPWFYTLIRR